MIKKELSAKTLVEQVDVELLIITLGDGFDLKITVSLCLIIFGVLFGVMILLFKRFWGNGLGLRSLEIDQAEIGVGNQKLTLKPNFVDKQIAYKIWVELSTRKIGLQIDLQHDVITEIYDSWYSFFAITRELIKDVPVAKFRREDTAKIIRLSIDILNEGIRPHLTKWQAQYRRWYDVQLRKEKNDGLSPQEIQENFPDYQNLKADLMKVNSSLIKYREIMMELISSK